MKMKDKVVKLAVEMSEMIYWIAGLEKDLQQNFAPNHDGLLTKEQVISLSKFFNQQICSTHKYEILFTEEHDAIQILRNVCDFKYTALDGARLLKEMREDFIEARDLINV